MDARDRPRTTPLRIPSSLTGLGERLLFSFEPLAKELLRLGAPAGGFVDLGTGREPNCSGLPGAEPFLDRRERFAVAPCADQNLGSVGSHAFGGKGDG